jgi:hypothetical protein
MRSVLDIPVPRVLSWNSKRETSSTGSEFIIMEKADGIPLAKVWNQLKVSDKLRVLGQILSYQRKWTLIKFNRFGSLYFAKDVPDMMNSPSTPLYQDKNGSPVDQKEYAIGPNVGREWSDEGRQTISHDLGPCKEPPSNF